MTAADLTLIRDALQHRHMVDDHGFVHAGFDTDALAALDRVETTLEAAAHPKIRSDLLWMAEGRKKRDRKHTDDLLAALARLNGNTE